LEGAFPFTVEVGIIFIYTFGISVIRFQAKESNPRHLAIKTEDEVSERGKED
jgi:hypothetical protein